MDDLLEIQHLNFQYHKKHILYDISFTLRKGEVIAIIGPSGSGKSTLLKALAMITPPSKAEIVYRGKTIFSSKDSVSKQDFYEYKCSVGMVFQELYLWPHLSVVENIMLPLVKGRNIGESLAKDKAMNTLAKLSLEKFANQHPNKLSVGQQQRCAIARTLVMDPAILFLDEITSALDPELVAGILELIKNIATDSSKTLLVVTHEMKFAKDIAHRIGYLENGRMCTIGKPDEIFDENINPRIAKFCCLNK